MSYVKNGSPRGMGIDTIRYSCEIRDKNVGHPEGEIASFFIEPTCGPS